MKKIYLLSLLALFQSISLLAQNTSWTYHSPHHDILNEDRAYAVTPAKDGGYVYTGKYGVNGFNASDVFIEKLSATGQLEWSKVYNLSISGDEGRSIIALGDGSFIISGLTLYTNSSTGDTTYKNLLMKVDQNGDTLWTKRYGGSKYSIAEGLGGCVDTTADGGFVMTGKFPSGNNNDFCIIKTNGSGDSLWAKIYGGSGSDIPRSVHLTDDGGFIIAGTTKSYPAVNSGNIWLLKTNSTGDTSWTKVIGDIDEEECFSVKQTVDKGYILAGRTGNNGTLSSELFLVKTDASGNVQWSSTFGNPADNDFGRDVVQTADKGYAMTGARIATHGYPLRPPLLYVVKTDSMGVWKWEKELGYDNTPNGAVGYCIANTSDGGLIVAGSDQPNVYTTLSCITTNSSNTVTTSSTGSLFINMSVTGTGIPVGSSVVSILNSTTFTISNNATASGTSTLSFDSGGEELRSFIIKFAPPVINGIPGKEEKQPCFIYPNPFRETATIVIPEKVKGATQVDIYDVAGQLVLSKHAAAGIHQVTVSKNEIPSGIYLYHIYSAESTINYRGKIIAE